MHKTIWMLNFVPELKPFLYAVKDEEKLEIIEEVIQQFENIVIPKLDSLAKGVYSISSLRFFFYHSIIYR
jgi:F0F1-type ATP synthase delta subunit